MNLIGKKIAVIGLGYVGLPLAVEFGKLFPVIGYDISRRRIEDLRAGKDVTGEVKSEDLHQAIFLEFADDAQLIRSANIFIVTVPTPVDRFNRPDFKPLLDASGLVGASLKRGDVVVYESTVYPGATEEVCVPILEQKSGLKYNIDFYCGYSPERINPGDPERRLVNIKKITSGSTPEVADAIDDLYKTIIKAGTYKASSIRVAEAAKVIENTQRDVNIALVNELAVLFNRLGIDTGEVLEAAGTKWNFLPFRPGLVGGHCIGVDPYYLTHKAQEVGYHPEVILAGRRINDGMGFYVADQVVKLMLKRKINPINSKTLILGLTFKENCPDLRNSKVVDVINGFRGYGVSVDVYDPVCNPDEARHEYGLIDVDRLGDGPYDAIVLAVAHRKFLNEDVGKVRALLRPGGIVYDVKHVLPRELVDGRL